MKPESNMEVYGVEGLEEIDPEIVIEVPEIPGGDYAGNSNPLQDKMGRSRWVRTRQCFCLDSKVDSCNIVKRTRCPSESLDKTQRGPGRWLWATNPDFNKAEPEQMEIPGTERNVSCNSEGILVG